MTTAASPVAYLPPDTVTYHPDKTKAKVTALAMVASAVGGGALTVVAWKIMKSTHLPAFNTSMVTRALATVGMVFTLVLTAALLLWWVLDTHRNGTKDQPSPLRPAWRTWLTQIVAYMSPALLTLSAIGVPLSASRLWLDGIQVDQVFRTQFLTRMTDTAANQDMNYADMPSYYPIGWFWLGGRFANAMGLPGWEAYQPWALVTLAASGCMLVPLWRHLSGSLPVATAIALTTTAITLATAAEEPYSAIIGMGVPAVSVLSAHAFRGSWWATFGIAIYLGISASFYTLFTGAVAITIICLVGILTAMYIRSWQPIIRTVIIGVTSLAIAAVAWGPYLVAAMSSNVPLESAAQHYLPEEGTQVPVPFLSPTLVGLLCLIGIIYLVLRISDAETHTMTLALIGLYLWVLASMVFTLAGTTLLGFRLEILIVLQMATAGVLALAELRLIGVDRVWPQRFSAKTNKRITAAFVVILALGGLHYAQQIPERNEDAIDHAYSDTDGYGERADKFTSNSAQNYITIHEFLESHGHKANETVVMSDEKLFMAYYPYWGFNAFTAHYANPLGEFSVRNDQIQKWGDDSWNLSPEEFAAELDNSPWHIPDVMMFRGSVKNPGAGYKIHIAEDIYPNQPNVRYRSVFYNPKVFSDKLWDVEQVGPFVIAARKSH